jgi:hypothetical protein
MFYRDLDLERAGYDTGHAVGYAAGYPVGFIKGLFEALKARIKSLINFFKSKDVPNRAKILKILIVMFNAVDKALLLFLARGGVRLFKRVKDNLKLADALGEKVAELSSAAIAGGIVLSITNVIRKIIKKIIRVLDSRIEKIVSQEQKVTRDSMCIRCIHGMSMCDAGVKGMKKGQHVKARDPEYVESLRGGGGMNRNNGYNKPSGGNPILRSKKASMALGAGMGAAGSAAGLGIALKGGLLKGGSKKAIAAGALLGTGISAGIGALNGYSSHKNYMRQQGINKLLKRNGY